MSRCVYTVYMDMCMYICRFMDDLFTARIYRIEMCDDDACGDKCKKTLMRLRTSEGFHMTYLNQTSVIRSQLE